jgi:hypothetical protein
MPFLRSIGKSDEEAQAFWNYTQSLKRKITQFDTLASKSINRQRKDQQSCAYRCLRETGCVALVVVAPPMTHPCI